MIKPCDLVTSSASKRLKADGVEVAPAEVLSTVAVSILLAAIVAAAVSMKPLKGVGDTTIGVDRTVVACAAMRLRDASNERDKINPHLATIFPRQALAQWKDGRSHKPGMK